MEDIYENIAKWCENGETVVNLLCTNSKVYNSIRKSVLLKNKAKRLLLSNDHDPNTALLAYLLTNRCRLDVVQMLEKFGADIHCFDENPLYVASSKGHLDAVKYFVNSGAIYVSDEDDGPIQVAIHNDHLEVTKYLVTNGLLFDCYKDNALVMACTEGKLRIVKYLVEERNTSVDTFRGDPLKAAISERELGVIKYLLKSGADIRHHEISDAVIESGDIDLVKLFVEYGLDAQQALVAACLNGEIDIVEYLLTKGVDINAGVGEALFQAAANSHWGLVKILVNAGADPSLNNQIAFHLACDEGEFEIVKFLVNRGARIFERSSTALINACTSENFELINYLLHLDTEKKYDYKAAITELTSNAMTVVKIEIVKLLLKNYDISI